MENPFKYVQKNSDLFGSSKSFFSLLTELTYAYTDSFQIFQDKNKAIKQKFIEILQVQKQAILGWL